VDGKRREVLFNSQTPKPLTGAQFVPDDDEGGGIQPTLAEFEPAWKCDACGYYEAVSQPWGLGL